MSTFQYFHIMDYSVKNRSCPIDEIFDGIQICRSTHKEWPVDEPDCSSQYISLALSFFIFSAPGHKLEFHLNYLPTFSENIHNLTVIFLRRNLTFYELLFGSLWLPLRVFGKAAMPFPCNGIVLIQGNLARVILVFTFNYACFFIPYFNLLISFHWERPSFVFDLQYSAIPCNDVIACLK